MKYHMLLVLSLPHMRLAQQSSELRLLLSASMKHVFQHFMLMHRIEHLM